MEVVISPLNTNMEQLYSPPNKNENILLVLVY